MSLGNDKLQVFLERNAGTSTNGATNVPRYSALDFNKYTRMRDMDNEGFE
jgi:hypothetical protein